MKYVIEYKICHMGKDDEQGVREFSNKREMNKFVNKCLRNFAEVKVYNKLNKILGE